MTLPRLLLIYYANCLVVTGAIALVFGAFVPLVAAILVGALAGPPLLYIWWTDRRTA